MGFVGHSSSHFLIFSLAFGLCLHGIPSQRFSEKPRLSCIFFSHPFCYQPGALGKTSSRANRSEPLHVAEQGWGRKLAIIVSTTPFSGRQRMLLLFRVGLLIVFSLFDCEADSASLHQQVFYCNEQFKTLFFFIWHSHPLIMEAQTVSCSTKYTSCKLSWVSGWWGSTLISLSRLFSSWVLLKYNIFILFHCQLNW